MSTHTSDDHVITGVEYVGEHDYAGATAQTYVVEINEATGTEVWIIPPTADHEQAGHLICDVCDRIDCAHVFAVLCHEVERQIDGLQENVEVHFTSDVWTSLAEDGYEVWTDDEDAQVLSRDEAIEAVIAGYGSPPRIEE